MTLLPSFGGSQLSFDAAKFPENLMISSKQQECSWPFLIAAPQSAIPPRKKPILIHKFIEAAADNTRKWMRSFVLCVVCFRFVWHARWLNISAETSLKIPVERTIGLSRNLRNCAISSLSPSSSSTSNKKQNINSLRWPLIFRVRHTNIRSERATRSYARKKKISNQTIKEISKSHWLWSLTST